MINRRLFLCVFFFIKFAHFIRSGKFLSGLVKKICLPDRMSGKNLNTFANTVLPSRTCFKPDPFKPQPPSNPDHEV